MRTYDYDETLSLLRAAVELKGEDYVYVNPDGEVASDDGSITDCFYVDNGSGEAAPSCIVAHVFHAMGIPVLDMLKIEGSSVNSDVTEDLLRDNSIQVTPRATRLLYSAQDLQDSGHTWGVAVECAVRYAYER